MSTKISIATTKNTVTVNGETKVVSVVTAGAQGAKGIELDETGRIDRSLIYYDQTAQSYKSDATVTTSELTDGGNF